MAKVEFDSIVEEIRGKIGNLVYVHGRNGTYVKMRVKPINRKTTQQMRVRGNMTCLSRMWGSLTENQMRGWIKARDEWTYGNLKKRNVTGFNLFLKRNMQLALNDFPIITDYPGFKPKPCRLCKAKVKIKCKKGYEDILLTYNYEFDRNQYLIVYATGMMSMGRQPQKGMFKRLGMLNADENPGNKPISLMDMYEPAFGKWFLKNRRIAFKFVVIDGETGAVGQEYIVSVDLLEKTRISA